MIPLFSIGHQEFLCKDVAHLNRIMKAMEGVKMVKFLRREAVAKYRLSENDRFSVPVKIRFESIDEVAIVTLPKNISESNLI